MKLKIVLALAFSCAAAVAAVAPPPPTPAGKDFETIHGVHVNDPYRWLQNGADPKVQAWSDVQAARTRAYLDALPYRALLRKRLAALDKGTSPQYLQLAARGPYVFAPYADPKVQQPVLVALDGALANRRAIVDPNRLDAKGLATIDWYEPSADGAKVAVSLSHGGTEDGTLHVFDTASGKESETPIPRVQYPTAGGSLAWFKEGKGFWYTRYPDPARAKGDDAHFNMQVFFHKLGSDAKTDALALGTKDGLERVSEVYLDNRAGSAEALAMVQRGDGNSWAYYVLGQGAAPVRIATYEDDIAFATIGPDGAVYAISRRNSSNGRIVKLKPPFAPGGLAAAPVIVPESAVAILSGGAEEHVYDLALTRDRLFVRDIVGGPNQVRVFNLDGAPKGKLPLPDIAANDEIVPLPGGDVLFSAETYLTPRYYMRWRAAADASRPTALRIVSPIKFDDTEVMRVFAISKDGTKIPVNVMMKRGTRLDGSHPMMLWGYGGFGISEVPRFIGAERRVWLDADGIYAVANIRGGSEYGERWHQQGMLLDKQNCFDDYYAAARLLIDRKYTSRDKLSLKGGSNGGLLMGAVMAQHPELSRAVVSHAGVYDMIQWGREPNGVFTATEYGSAKDAAQFKAIYAYSPYHHLAKGARYPAVMLFSGANDDRVDPEQSRKFAAMLQAATASPYPVFLRTSKTSGHGQGMSEDELIDTQADELAFLFDQLGMKP